MSSLTPSGIGSSDSVPISLPNSPKNSPNRKRLERSLSSPALSIPLYPVIAIEDRVRRSSVSIIEASFISQIPELSSSPPRIALLPVSSPYSTAILPAFLILNNNAAAEKEKEEDATKKFVHRFNEEILHTENFEKAQTMIKRMRQLGGLEPADSPDQKVNIVKARKGLVILTSLKDTNYKIQILDSLLELLKRDEVTKETSEGLVSLAIKLMKNMDRQLIQQEILEVQIKIAKVYSLIAVLLQYHYAKKHFNAITEPLKQQFTTTANNFNKLNRHKDTKLEFYLRSALEGMERLKTDKEELFDLLDRFYHLLAAGASGYMNDALSTFDHLSRTFKDLDPHVPKAWYNGFLILKDLGKSAKSDINKLIGVQTLLQNGYESTKHTGHRSKTLNWKFIYGALEVLYDICLHGNTKEIRKGAFEGLIVDRRELPGLKTFADFQKLSKYVDKSQFVHLEMPKMTDPNLFIRQACIEHLIDLSKNAPDKSVRKASLNLLQRRQATEQDTNIRQLIDQALVKN